MPKIEYVPKRFNPKAELTIDRANVIIKEYQAQGFDLTLRQLYYQFVSRDFIPNTQRDYKNLGVVINHARLAGLIDWDAIVDRTRSLRGTNHWESPAELLRATVNKFKTDKWAQGETRVEVWIEKDALVGVIERVCIELDVDYFSCRGYVSQSELWSAAQRLIGYNDAGQKAVIVHLGDHDPSGKDMTRDIEDRFKTFGVENFELNRIALNMDQVRKYRPPPNPAKITDSRAKGYIREFGAKSWELDALEPKVLSQLIRKAISEHLDKDLYDEACEREREGQSTISEAADEMESAE